MNRIIYSNTHHPFYDLLSKLEGFTDSWPEDSNSLLLDFSATSTKEKEKLFSQYSGPIITDLSLNNGEELLKKFTQIQGAFAAVYPSPKKTYEVFYKDQEYKESLDSVFNKLESKLLEVSKVGVGFIFPRTIAQIINEAWYALEDDLATKEAIDTAMLFGVNYPLGPLNWGEKAGLANTVILLEELHKTTNQDRYLVCPKLKKGH